MYENKKIRKNKELKIINHIGTLYGTVDGEKFWQLERYIYELIKLCNGNKTFDDIVNEVAKKAAVDPEELKPLLKEIFEVLESANFVEFV